jgi:hypothetical protein
MKFSGYVFTVSFVQESIAKIQKRQDGSFHFISCCIFYRGAQEIEASHTLMGAAASIPDHVDEATARHLAGEKFDQNEWDKLAVDGSVSRDFFARAAEKFVAEMPRPKSSLKSRRPLGNISVTTSHTRVSFDVNQNEVHNSPKITTDADDTSPTTVSAAIPSNPRIGREQGRACDKQIVQNMNRAKEGWGSLYYSSGGKLGQNVVCQSNQARKSAKKSKRQSLRDCRKAALKHCKGKTIISSDLVAP